MGSAQQAKDCFTATTSDSLERAKFATAHSHPKTCPSSEARDGQGHPSKNARTANWNGYRFVECAFRPS
jgi:hypothetical protein